MAKQSGLFGLPPELLLNTLEFLNIEGLLQLRLTCKKIAATCLEMLQKRCTRLYLHPLRLADVLVVCAEDKYAKHIDEIVVLGRSNRRTGWNSGWGRDQRLNNRPWPQYLTFATEAWEPTYKDFMKAPKHPNSICPRSDEQQPFFSSHYKGLLDAVGGLPKLKKLTYAGSSLAPGFCQVSKSAINEHAEKHADWRRQFGGEGQKDHAWAQKSFRWSDAEVLATLLAASGAGTFTEVSFTQPVLMCTKMMSKNLFPDREIQLQARDVQRLLLTMPGNEGWKVTCKGILESAPVLERLTIGVSSSVDSFWGMLLAEYAAEGVRHRVDVWDEEGGWRDLPQSAHTAANLEHLEIRGLSKVPDPLSANPVIKLLRGCRSTLKTVQLHNVCFSHYGRELDANDSEDDDEITADITTSMSAVIKELRQLEQAEDIQFTVPELPCDAAGAEETNSEHSPLCARYATYFSFMCEWEHTADVFRDLASRFGVQLEDTGQGDETKVEKQRWWNFARTTKAGQDLDV